MKTEDIRILMLNKNSRNTLGHNFKMENKTTTNMGHLLFITCLIIVYSVVILEAVPNEDPVIYLYLSRWENRSISPRSYYLRLLSYRKGFNSTSRPMSLKQDGQYDDAQLDFTGRIGDKLSKAAEVSSISAVGEFNENDSKMSSLLSQMEQRGKYQNLMHPLSEAKDSMDSEAGFSFPREASNPNNRLQGRTVIIDDVPSSTRTGVDGSSTFLYRKKDEIRPFLESSDAIATLGLALRIIKNGRWSDLNVVFSPFSIANVLGLLFMGSRGNTFDEIAKQFYPHETSLFPESDKVSRFHASFKSLLVYLTAQSGSQVSLEIANEVFTDTKCTLNSTYVQNAKILYDAPVQSFDFNSGGADFVKNVNEWVQEKTKNKINRIIDAPPSPETKLALLNAVYFRGAWEMPFPSQFTQTKPFFVEPDKSVPVQLMTNLLTVPYVDTPDYKMIGIPYKGNFTGFFVILPKNHDGVSGIKELEWTLNEPDLRRAISSMVYRKVSLKLPRMKVETDGRLREVLTQMNLTSMFNDRYANFDQVSKNCGLFVSQIYHRAVMEVNEKGTEAAAVTAATGDRIMEEVPIPFHANRPFLFFIYHVKADTVLFWGRITRPEQIN